MPIPSMVHEKFKHALARTYRQFKSQHPTEGRRKWRLRSLYESWQTLGPLSASLENSTDVPIDADPLDEFLEDDGLGLLIRTDFSNNDAWNTFLQKMQEAQKELLSEFTGNGSDAQLEGNDEAKLAAGPSANAEDEESDSSSETPEIIKILDPVDSPDDRTRLSGISNVTALRLFNDVDIRPTPALPAGTKPYSPPNPLIDHNGWQEIYTGKTLWIYDARSNTDECVRLVSQQPDFYGTATGDSWRARVAHIPELQFNMVYQGMKIDFNGMDKYDYSERARNLTESTNL